MAIAFRASATATQDTTVTAHAITVPASVQTGDLLLVIYCVKTANAPTAPSGWTLIDVHINPASTDTGTSAYYRLAQSGDASTSFTWTAPTAAIGTLAMVAWSGVDQAAPITGALVDSSATSSTTPTSATLAGTGELDVPAVAVRGTALAGAGPTFTPPAGYTELVDVTNAPSNELECAISVAESTTIDAGTAKSFTSSSNCRAVGLRFLLQAAGGQSAVVGLAAETDTALAVTRVKRRTVGFAAGTNTALPIGKRKGIGLAPEADAALAAGRAKRRSVGIATEADAGLSVHKRKGVTPAAEAASALAVQKSKRKGVGVATETVAALAVCKRKGVGVASELDAAQTVARIKRLSVSSGTVVDSALPVHKRKGVGLAEETDIAIGVIFVPDVNVTITVGTTRTGLGAGSSRSSWVAGVGSVDRGL